LHAAGTTAITSADQFKALTSGSPTPVLVEFGASWCKKCKVLAPIVSRLAGAAPSLLVCTVDIDELGDLAEELGISSVPRIQVFKAGSLSEDYMGSSESDVEALFQRASS